MPESDELIEQAVLAGGLNARYKQAHRHYHNLAHIEFVLASIDVVAPGLELPEVRLAAWFHDAVYAPGRDDNEERSAFVAAEALEVVGAPPALIGEVKRLVLLTREHAPLPDDASGALLSDADLRVLSSEKAEYTEYAEKVRQEYKLLSNEIFFPARRKILESFLERSHIYATPYGREHWEGRARSNVSDEIDKLAGRT